jgi:hypothetical protein
MAWKSDVSASDAIQTMLDVYRHDMQEGQWTKLRQHDADASRVLDDIERLAAVLTHRADHLRGRAPLLEIADFVIRHNDLVRSADLLAFVSQRINLVLSESAIGMTHGAEERFWKLIELVRPTNTSKRARRFLRRVSRCFLYDMHPECVVMCRGAIDVELESEVSNDLCAKILASQPARHFTLADRIAVATQSGRLTFEVAEAARRVQREGNAIVHHDADRVDDAYPYIRGVIAVLAELDAALGSGER